ncbi:MAG: TonB-dependent receptor plug domain-containing protein, partial [Burkholderiales bacterium]|nr:TonB-dependent receptor plug domain-containing protein [Burkholderiales bacterium]
MKKTILTGVIACALTPAFADNTPTTFDLGTLVVTATRTPTPVRELLNDISVITQEDIQRAGQTTLPELLRSLPGIEFSTNGGAGTSSNVYIRGANPNHTLVLIDGMRINSAT